MGPWLKVVGDGEEEGGAAAGGEPAPPPDKFARKPAVAPSTIVGASEPNPGAVAAAAAAAAERAERGGDLDPPRLKVRGMLEAGAYTRSRWSST